MAECKDCKPGCFDTPLGDCLYHDGQSIGVLEQGDLQKVVNYKLALEVQKLRDLISKCSTCSSQTSSSTNASNIGVGNINTTSTSSVSMSTKPFSLVSTPTDDNVNIDYDFTEAVNSYEGNIVQNKITVSGMSSNYPSIVKSTDKVKGSFNLNPDNFPATMLIESRIQTSDGEITATQSVELDPTGQQVNSYLQVKDRSGPIETQDDLNKAIMKQLSSLESRLSSVVGSDLLYRVSKIETEISTG